MTARLTYDGGNFGDGCGDDDGDGGDSRGLAPSSWGPVVGGVTQCFFEEPNTLWDKCGCKCCLRVFQTATIRGPLKWRRPGGRICLSCDAVWASMLATVPTSCRGSVCNILCDMHAGSACTCVRAFVCACARHVSLIAAAAIDLSGSVDTVSSA